jgi:hypothetical protein
VSKSLKRDRHWDDEYFEENIETKKKKDKARRDKRKDDPFDYLAETIRQVEDRRILDAIKQKVR